GLLRTSPAQCCPQFVRHRRYLAVRARPSERPLTTPGADPTRGRQMLDFIHQLALGILIGPIVVTPLDKAGAGPFAFVTLVPKPVAPFDKVSLAEHVFIIGSSPYENDRFNAERVQPIVN